MTENDRSTLLLKKPSESHEVVIRWIRIGVYVREKRGRPRNYYHELLQEAME